MKKLKKNKLGEKVFTYIRDDGLKSFAFHAIDIEDAKRKIIEWNLYHSFSMLTGYKIIEGFLPGKDQYGTIGDEWMKRF